MTLACFAEVESESQEVALRISLLIVSSRCFAQCHLSLKPADTNPLHATEIIDLTLSDYMEVNAQTRDRYPASRNGVLVRRLVFDLTVEIERCAICSNVLGQGSDSTSRMFAFETCGCVCFTFAQYAS